MNIIVYDYIDKILIGIDLFTVLFRTYYILYDFIAYTHHLKFQTQRGSNAVYNFCVYLR